jgi:hypothetical protein
VTPIQKIHEALNYTLLGTLQRGGIVREIRVRVGSIYGEPMYYLGVLTEDRQWFEVSWTRRDLDCWDLELTGNIIEGKLRPLYDHLRRTHPTHVGITRHETKE